MNKELSNWVDGIVKENYTIKEWEAYQDGYAQACKDSDEHYKTEIESLNEEIKRIKLETLRAPSMPKKASSKS